MIHLVRAALVAAAMSSMMTQSQADCIIAPDGKSIDVVSDNPSSDEKNCAMKCQVDTKIGVVQISCGGNTPPLAKGHSLCSFDKPEPWYKKVVSSEGSCKAVEGSVPAIVAPPVLADSGGFTCRISADGKTVDTLIANPYKSATSCQVDCAVSGTRAGSTHSVSCTKTVEPGVGQVVICSHTYDNERLVKMVSGAGSCLNPEPSAAKAEKDEDDPDVENLANDPDRLHDYIRRQLDPKSREMLDKMHVP